MKKKLTEDLQKRGKHLLIEKGEEAQGETREGTATAHKTITSIVTAQGGILGGMGQREKTKAAGTAEEIRGEGQEGTEMTRSLKRDSKRSKNQLKRLLALSSQKLNWVVVIKSTESQK